MRGVIALLLVVAAPAAADPGRHLVYAEALGKAGPYGVGWELEITPRLALGAAASFAIVDDQQLYTGVPYLHATLVRGARHALFGELGLALVHSRLPSPVPEWDGMRDTGAGGEASVGWEWRPSRVVLRLALGAAVGEGGVAPFAGLLVGARP